MARDEGKLKAIVDIQFAGVEAEMKRLGKALEGMGHENTFGTKLRDALAQAFKDVERIGEKLETTTDENALVGLQAGMENVADNAARAAREVAKMATKGGKTFVAGEIKASSNALRQYASEMQQVTKATQRTSLASQNMLRVIQDSPFGMLGMANNIQMLGEDISRGLAKGVSAAETLKGAFMNLIKGPMAPAAVIAIATIIIQNWDKIESAAIGLMERLKGLTDAQRELNKAFREFESDESFAKFVEDLDDDKMVTALVVGTQRLGERTEAMKELMGAVTPAELQEFVRMQEIIYGGHAIGGQARMHLANRMTAMMEEKNLTKEHLAELIRMQQEYNDEAERLELIKNANAMRGVSNARDEYYGVSEDDDEKNKKKEQQAALKAFQEKEALHALHLEAMAFATQIAGETRNRIREEVDAEMKEWWGEVDAELKAAEDAAKQLQNLIKNQFRAGQGKTREADQNAMAIGMGQRQAGVDDSYSQRQALIDANLLLEREGIAMRIEARKKEQEDIEMLLQDATGAQVGILQRRHAVLMGEINKFHAQDEKAVADSENEKAKLRKQKQDEQLQAMSGFATSMSGAFGSMAELMAKSSEDGLEKHKGMLKAAAWADAVASSIAVFRTLITGTGPPGPAKIAMAAAGQAAVLANLAVAIRQIDNPGGGGGGGSKQLSGSFTSLNSQVTSDRVTDFQQQQDRLNATSSAASAGTAGAIKELGNKLAGQKVILDRGTAAQAVSAGNNMNQRRVQNTNLNSN